jgi:NAD(P)-dependent dehydrogenase (short-subunit alcohol dehydrogenase family)
LCRGGDFKKTVDGIEDKFAVNHLGVFLFTNLILDRVIKAGKGARIVVLSSRGHQRSPIRWDDWGWSVSFHSISACLLFILFTYTYQDGKSYDAPSAYGQSKTANVLFAVSLADKLKSKGVLAYSVHPGGIMTNLGRNTSLEWLRSAGLFPFAI